MLRFTLQPPPVAYCGMPPPWLSSGARVRRVGAIAYLLQQNGFPAGDKELTPHPEIFKAVRLGTATPAGSPLPPR